MHTAARKNILITCGGGGGPIFLAKELSKDHDIFLVDGSDQNVGPHLGFPFEKIPFGSSPEFIPAMKELISKWNIDLIVPGADEELLPVDQLRRESKDLAAVIPTQEFIKLCLDKKALMRVLAKDGISELLGFETMQEVRYPAIGKPISGRGSRQFHILKSKDELEGYLKLYGKIFEEVLFQPYIEGVEYTVSVIVNNLNKLIGVVPKRVIEKRGITRAAVTEHNSLIEEISHDIVRRYTPSGTFNIQLKLWNGKAYIFEINPRLSTTSVLSDKAFGNEVGLYLRYFNEEVIVNPPELKEGVALYRYEENIFR